MTWDILAPGVDMFGACGGATRCDTVSDSSYSWSSGTSMAVPLVAGVSAVYLSNHPNASPQEVIDAVVTRGATKGRFLSSFPSPLNASNSNTTLPLYMRPGTPDRLLFSGVLNEDAASLTAQVVVAASEKKN